MKPYIDDIAQADFDSCKPMIAPLFHVICLLWANCKHYCVSARLIVILAEISNLLILQCRTFLDASSVFKGEVEETLVKVNKALEILKHFRDMYTYD